MTTPEEQKVELLPCPFCGNTKITIEWEACPTLHQSDTNRRWFAECCGCSCQGPFCQKESQVILAWNNQLASNLVQMVHKQLQQVTKENEALKMALEINKSPDHADEVVALCNTLGDVKAELQQVTKEKEELKALMTELMKIMASFMAFVLDKQKSNIPL